jgi:hypothetical protein
MAQEQNIFLVPLMDYQKKVLEHEEAFFSNPFADNPQMNSKQIEELIEITGENILLAAKYQKLNKKIMEIGSRDPLELKLLGDLKKIFDTELEVIRKKEREGHIKQETIQRAESRRRNQIESVLEKIKEYRDQLSYKFPPIPFFAFSEEEKKLWEEHEQRCRKGNSEYQPNYNPQSELDKVRLQMTHTYVEDKGRIQWDLSQLEEALKNELRGVGSQRDYLAELNAVKAREAQLFASYTGKEKIDAKKKEIISEKNKNMNKDLKDIKSMVEVERQELKSAITAEKGKIKLKYEEKERQFKENYGEKNFKKLNFDFIEYSVPASELAKKWWDNAFIHWAIPSLKKDYEDRVKLVKTEINSLARFHQAKSDMDRGSTFSESVFEVDEEEDNNDDELFIQVEKKIKESEAAISKLEEKKLEIFAESKHQEAKDKTPIFPNLIDLSKDRGPEYR